MIIVDYYYKKGWEDGFNKLPFCADLVNNEEYRNGFCNGAYWREIVKNERKSDTPPMPRCIEF